MLMLSQGGIEHLLMDGPTSGTLGRTAFIII